MTLSQLWNMVLRIFIRKGVNWGINQGMRHMARGAKGQGTPGPADQAQARQARDLAKRARKAARLTRRIGR